LSATKENHDLFELGIQNKDYSLNRDGTYHAITRYPANWAGFGLTWNPWYVTFSELITGTNREYREYELKESSFVKLPMTGFAFDTSDINLASQIAQINAITDKILRTKQHGILSDGTRTFGSAAEMMNTIIKEAYTAGLQNIQDALAKQIQTHLDTQR
jgi:putative aldouronate transport system substrate-binding protein